MVMTICRHCGSHDLKRKEVELRRIHAGTMAVASRQRVTELECTHCGWVDAIEGWVSSH